MNNLKIEKLTVRYDNMCDYIIKNFDLEVKAGEFLVVLGNSGCGKSTLLLAISGLKKPCNGKIKFGENIFFDSEKNIDMASEKRNIGFCFQSYALWPHMTIKENISFPLKVRKLKNKDIENKVEKILEIVDLKGYENRYPNELSGGQKQRISLARAIVYNPKLLLLDEPLANLDAKLKEELAIKIKKIHKKLGLTTIYVTHDQNEAFSIADRIVIMKKGKIMQIGDSEEIYNNPKNLFVANFIGKNNILTLEQANKLKLHFEMDKNTERHKICIRPEDIVIKEIGEKYAYIKKIVFHGYYIEYTIEYKQIKLLVREFNKKVRNINDKIGFEIKEAKFKKSCCIVD